MSTNSNLLQVVATNNNQSKIKLLLTGGCLQTMEGLTVGMPFEVWKTKMGANRALSTTQAFQAIYAEGGIKSFYRGWQAKAFESFSKGGILLYSKEVIVHFSTKGLGFSEVTAGFLGGFGGGVTQVSVMAPCTYLITASVAGAQAQGGSMSAIDRIKHTFKTHGISGFYRGSGALAARQGSNWASRQGLTDFFREHLKSHRFEQQLHQTKNNRNQTSFNGNLSILDETIAGTIGGCLSAWNQPVEVLRIDAQTRAAKGLPSQNMFITTKNIVLESGVPGLFKGIVPRMGLCTAQTLYMVTVPYIMKSYGF